MSARRSRPKVSARRKNADPSSGRAKLAAGVRKAIDRGTLDGAPAYGWIHARETLKKLDGVSEDDVKHAEKELQKVHDEYIAKIDAAMKAKEKELMEV